MFGDSNFSPATRGSPCWVFLILQERCIDVAETLHWLYFSPIWSFPTASKKLVTGQMLCWRQLKTARGRGGADRQNVIDGCSLGKNFLPLPGSKLAKKSRQQWRHQYQGETMLTCTSLSRDPKLYGPSHLDRALRGHFGMVYACPQVRETKDSEDLSFFVQV